ncbi:hypothetical protein FNV43_RR20260 [Rhamnella rubrinervis]|uniref:Uncharacterized protein n=1 Tax=Rhamnella rubrinervis TaxID=2594499 RepID=A0A8K0DZD4_9ROSA|nr:hypothetical protein FNV43_RR20260 [Rhamnella rubrinervis]
MALSRWQEYFQTNDQEFGIQPRAEHYVHMVKLGMGELEEAYNLILSLPNSWTRIWGALLSCCDACGNPEMAESVAKGSLEIIRKLFLQISGPSWTRPVRCRLLERLVVDSNTQNI